MSKLQSQQNISTTILLEINWTPSLQFWAKVLIRDNCTDVSYRKLLTNSVKYLSQLGTFSCNKRLANHFIRRTTNTQSRCSLSGNGHDLTLRYRSRRATLRLLFGTGLNKEGKSIDKVLISVTSTHWYGVLEQCNFYRKQLFQVAGPETIADILSDGMWRPALPIAQCTVCTCKWYLLSLYSASRYSSTFLESKGKKEILTSFENASKSTFWVIWNKISQEITKYWSHSVIRIDSRYQFVFDLIEDKPKWCNFFKSHSNCR